MRIKSNMPVLVKHVEQWLAQSKHSLSVFKMKCKIIAEEISQGMSSFTQYLILKDSSHWEHYLINGTVRGKVKMFTHDFSIANALSEFVGCFLGPFLNKHQGQNVELRESNFAAGRDNTFRTCNV